MPAPKKNKKLSRKVKLCHLQVVLPLVMSQSWIKYVLWTLLAAFIWACNVESCIEEERLALLELTTYLRSHVDPNYVQFFDGLGEREEDIHNCCTWARVLCNSTTQHVIELKLDSMVDVKKPWFFNVTMLQPFGELVSLDLTANGIGGLVAKDGMHHTYVTVL